MTVRRDLVHCQRHFLGPARFGLQEAAAEVKREAATQIGESKRGLSITAVGGANQLEQNVVLRDWQQLPFAKHPAGRREVPGEYTDFAYIWWHFQASFSSAMEICP